jgi:mRNA-degrading endonuclease toxin of MazEF toxin-antitoxin module
VWRYQSAITRPGQSSARLVVSAAAINRAEHLPVVLALHVVDTNPGGLLAVSLGELGWATALSIEPVLRSRLVERLTIVGPDTMDRIDAALRAAQDL